MVFEFTVIFLILAFILYAPVGYNLSQTRYQLAQKVCHYYLDRICLEGWLSVQDEEALIEDFKNIGINVTRIEAPRENLGYNRVLRNTTNVSVSTVWLQVEGYPTGGDFNLSGLLGATPDSVQPIIVGGRGISERVDP